MGESTRDWPSQGNCRNKDPDTMFVQGAEQNRVKRICIGCPVIYQCLADALDNRIEFGVWGGRTERERRALLRRHPEVDNWRRLFETVVQQHEASQRTAETGQQPPNIAPALGNRAMDAIPPPAPPMLRPDNDQIF